MALYIETSSSLLSWRRCSDWLALWGTNRLYGILLFRELRWRLTSIAIIIISSVNYPTFPIPALPPSSSHVANHLLRSSLRTKRKLCQRNSHSIIYFGYFVTFSGNTGKAPIVGGRINIDWLVIKKDYECLVAWRRRRRR